MTDAQGLPLRVRTGPANQRDDSRAAELLTDLPALPGGARPAVVQADRGYGFPHLLAVLAALGWACLIAPRGSPHGSGLGQTRYVVERTLAWFANFRRLRLCYERTWHSWQALHELAACVICANRLHKICAGQVPRRRKRRRRF